MNSPSSRRHENTSRNMFGPVVGSSRNDPQYSFVLGSTDTRYNGLASSNSSRSYPSFTVTSQPSRSEKVSALLRNIASISCGNDDAREPSINFNIVASPLLREPRMLTTNLNQQFHIVVELTFGNHLKDEP